MKEETIRAGHELLLERQEYINRLNRLKKAIDEKLVFEIKFENFANLKLASENETEVGVVMDSLKQYWELKIQHLTNQIANLK